MMAILAASLASSYGASVYARAADKQIADFLAGAKASVSGSLGATTRHGGNRTYYAQELDYVHCHLTK